MHLHNILLERTTTMRHPIILYCLVLCTASLAAQPPGQPTCTIPFERGAIVVLSVNDNKQIVDMASIMKHMSPLLAPVTPPENTKAFLQAAKHWCKQHPLKMGLGCCGLAYSALCINIMLLEYQLRHNGYWYAWKTNVDFDTLLSISRADLMQELIVCIHQRYAKLEGQAAPLMFMAALNALDKEIKVIERLQQISEWLTYVKIAFLFPYMDSAQFCSDTKRRLLYLKQLILDAYAVPYHGVHTEELNTQV